MLLLFESFPSKAAPISSSQEQALRATLLESESAEEVDDEGDQRMEAGASWISTSDKQALQASLARIRECLAPQIPDKFNRKRRLDGEPIRTQFQLQTQTQLLKKRRLASGAQRAASTAAVLSWIQADDEQALNARCADSDERHRILPLQARAKLACAKAGALRISGEVEEDVNQSVVSFQCIACDALPSSSSTALSLILSNPEEGQVGAIMKKCRNVDSVLSRCSPSMAVALLDDFHCHLIHASQVEVEPSLGMPGNTVVERVIRSSLQHSARKVRMAGGRLAHAFARRQCEGRSDGAKATSASLQSRLQGLIMIYKNTLKDHSQLGETTVIGLGLLGT